ncbi:amidohydrolase family protein [Nitriliruptor alkaliphilus]|uniref:amidohydrolase family protein n=1 Tax=Nitriliruptor alkaliphilus TaxID=427918 RepID=UPI000B1F76E4|nr:amidohydrolase family protein [Nitriliruptor alkaliphilus]
MTHRLLVTGIGTLLTGRIDAPIAEADAVLVEDGKVAAIGDASDLDGEGPVLDVNGATLAPGLVDDHVHPVLGDYTPRQHQANYLEGFVHGGVTTVISAGEVHTPGRPKDREGTKALAVLAAKSFRTVRPSGARVHAGALLLEEGLTEQDFRDLAVQGVHLVGEIGISGVQDPDTAAQMTAWAQAAGMTVTAHVGGKSVPTSRTIDAEFVVAVRPDVAAHVNGGPTATGIEDVERILVETDAYVELVHNGNVRAARDVATLVAERGELHRLLIGTDSPAGTGVVPLGVLRTLSWISALAGIPAPEALAAASGNTTTARRVAGGVIEVGAPADLIVTDAPDGSRADDFCGALAAGDTPAIAAVVVDGKVVVAKSRNTPPPKRVPRLPEG